MDMKSKNLNWFLELKIFIKSQVWLCVAAAAAKSLQSCPTLCDPIDSSPPGSPVPGILQARTLEWVAISFSNAWMWKVKMKSRSHVRLFATPWTAADQAPPSMGFSRQEYWSGVPMPSPVAFSRYCIKRIAQMLSQVVNKSSLFGNDGLPRQVNRGEVSDQIEAFAPKFDFYY